MAKRKIRKGIDLFREVPVQNDMEPYYMTNWDLWFLVVLCNQFDSDWDKMVDVLRQRAKNSLSERDTFESKLSHLQKLRQLLIDKQLTIDGCLGDDITTLLKKEKRKAETKILKQPLVYKDMSDWMINTPRKLAYEHALRGYWNEFPIPPTIYEQPMEHLFKTRGYYKANESFALETKLSNYLDKQEKNANDAQLFSLYRAFLTVMLEYIEMIDDSYGVIGTLYGQVFEGYVSLPRPPRGMSLEIFFQDLLELLIWEDYGFTWHEKPAFFAALTPDETDICVHILHTRWQELDALDFTYQTQEALEHLGMLCAQQKLFDRFIELAQVMGTKAWKPITDMAEVAEQNQRVDLAMTVYETALASSGKHQNFLQGKYEELKKRYQ
ncbi:MAG TPA: hypothetical protein VLL52_04400 [Anaerolineae bacterium]|nr:hypothetical protein [Anaerolineae bacterium]